MFGILLAAVVIGAIALTLYIDYLSEQSLKNSIKTNLPSTSWVEIESIKSEYGVEYGTTYNLKARQRDGSVKRVQMKCKRGNVSRYARISI